MSLSFGGPRLLQLIPDGSVVVGVAPQSKRFLGLMAIGTTVLYPFCTCLEEQTSCALVPDLGFPLVGLEAFTLPQPAQPRKQL